MSIEYRPRPYTGNAVIFISLGRALDPQQREAWEKYIRGHIQYEHLAGAESQILRLPYARDLAAHLLRKVKGYTHDMPE